jgi:MFS transporter, DHA1 family, tetracycline resistance protein
MNKSLLTLLMVVFIDACGLGILFPILNDLLINPYSGFLNFNISIESRHWLYSLVIFTFFLSWFFGAAFISKASDKIGRQKSLLICLYGIFTGYLLTIFSILFSSVTLLVIGRIIGGFTAGSQPVAQASIIRPPAK